MIKKAFLFIPLLGWFKWNTVSALQSFDLAFTRVFSKRLPRRGSLNSFLFHGLLKDKRECCLDYADPKQFISADELSRFVEYYFERGYHFVSPDEILTGLDPAKKYILLTFDDGYYNNRLALPILKKFKVPAVFFISPAYLKEGKSFWWNVLFRERFKRGVALGRIYAEIEGVKLNTAKEIQRYIISNFGEESFRVLSDIERPFTESELKEFAKEEGVYIGNHTFDHAILTNYQSEEIKEQILKAQESLYCLTGKYPRILSYPSGAYSPEVEKICRESGIELVTTCNSNKNYLPLNRQGSHQVISLNRFILSFDQDILAQSEIFESDYSLYLKSKNMFKRLSGC